MSHARILEDCLRDGVERGEPSLYVHLEENPSQMAHLVESYGTESDAPGLHRLYMSPVELQIDELVAYVSKFFMLKRGDVLFTGTPSGVGKIMTNDYLTGILEGEKMFAVKVK